jgi:hypothetical protein
MLEIARKGTWSDPTDGYIWNYYGDDANATIFYIVPRPQFSVDNNRKPMFRLVEYQTNDGANGSGYCHMQVQLTVPARVQTAIIADIRVKFGVDAQINTLNYNSGTSAQFEYLMPEQTEPALVQMTPTLVGGNIASFLCELGRDGVQVFKDAFSGVTGSLPVSYSLSIDARLPSVTAVVEFDSQAAFNYEKTVNVDRNIWGDVTRREVTVRSFLQSSQAGTITVDPGSPPPSPEALEEARQWAGNTLNNLVNNAVNTVLATINPGDANNFSMSMVQSFKETYAESQVVPWLFAPTDTLPSMPQLGFNFNDFYSTVDVRRFSLNVTMNLDFAETAPVDNPTAIRSVDVTVQYPGLAQNTFTFDFGNQAHLFDADWDEAAGGKYRISYRVNYWKAGQPPLEMPAQTEEASIFTISPEAAGIVQVVFDVSNIPWAGSRAYAFVQVEFFFQDLSGSNNPITQTLQLDMLNQTGEIDSIYAVPRFNPYIYTLIYKMNDGTEFRLQPQTSNAAKIYVNDPLQHSTLFTVLVKTPANNVDFALMDISYKGGLEGQPVSLSFQIPDPSKPNVTRLPFDVNAVNVSQVLFHYSGMLFLEDGTPIQIPDSVTGNTNIVISPDQLWFGVSIFADLIDWSNNLGMVTVDVTYLQSTAAGAKVPTTLSTPAPWTFKNFPTQNQQVVLGFLHPASEQARYDYTITYSYTDQQKFKVITGTSTSPTLTIPPTPDALNAMKDAARLIAEPAKRRRQARLHLAQSRA